ncbi:YwpF family protein [Bacillus smithii]|uniref:YwpF family protein n=1 Tax=Bacillus smithii TaxID=1479 RepID=UPI002E1DEC9E|nr:YwpF family protein [Bacillus smithii]
MKTFKLVSLQFIEDQDAKDIDFIDGLIINKEDEKRTWLIELFTDLSYYDYFRDVQQRDKDLEIQVIISRPENSPAYFFGHIHCIKKMESNVSVLLQGRLTNRQNEFAERLLTDLVQMGLSGEQLVREFSGNLKKDPAIPLPRFVNIPPSLSVCNISIRK